MALIVDIEGDSILVLEGFGWGEFGLSPEERVGGVKAEESHGWYDGVFEVGFHFNVSTFADLSLLFAVANNTGSLPEIGLIGDDLDATSFSDGDFAFVSTKIDTDGSRLKLLWHLFK